MTNLNQLRNRSGQSGFTLIELLIVVAIIGILAAIAVPSYQAYTQKAKFAANVSPIAGLKTSIEVCYSQQGTFADCDTAGTNGVAPIPTLPYESTGAAITANTAEITFTANAAAGGYNYALTPSLINGVITWSQAGSCAAAGVC